MTIEEANNILHAMQPAAKKQEKGKKKGKIGKLGLIKLTVRTGKNKISKE